ncbi:hypothetical protein [Chryseobacterium indoltheticum]|uniref:hypothetical protein n=1 Tax=Chryseobacterium indoltheticum TaxID=254 RepID=UPI0040413F1F
MKIKFIVLFSLLSAFLFSQQKDDKNFFPVEYILKNSQDTIKAKVRNVGKFSNKKYYFATIMFKMKMRDSDGNESWVQPDDIKYIKITDENNLKHEYFASSERLPKEQGLIEVLYEGKNINWYKDYHNPTLVMQLQIKGYITDNNKNILYWGFFDDLKRKFKIIFKDYPDLQLRLKSANTEEDFVRLLRLYDAKQ